MYWVTPMLIMFSLGLENGVGSVKQPYMTEDVQK